MNTDPILAEEIAWLRGFGWDTQRIADRLRVAPDTVTYYKRKAPTGHVTAAFETAQQFQSERRAVAHNAREARVAARRCYYRTESA